MEVAYGTDRGGVRVIVRHPENIGHTPQLFQSYNVHSNPVSKVVLGEKHLVSGKELIIFLLILLWLQLLILLRCAGAMKMIH